MLLFSLKDLHLDTASTVSLLVAFIAAGVSWSNSRQTVKNTRDVEDMKAAVNRDLETLKSKLSHGQLVNSTQWNAEFSAYQAVWAALATLQPIANRLVTREGKVEELGIPPEYFQAATRHQHRQKIATELSAAAEQLVSAIHNNAPFYPAPIREIADQAHKDAAKLLFANLAALSQITASYDPTQSETFIAENNALLKTIIGKTEKVQSLIRERLEAVQVVNPFVL